jgi:MFS transporter, BCD family, chlorophyll transporter
MLLKRLQLGLIHVAVAMTLVPINSTLNRVMIAEFAISATIVAVLASLPYFFSPIQMAIGSFSDRHPIFGLRRTPYILLGLIFCSLGVIVAPYVAFTIAENWSLGILIGALAFGAWGMGYNFAAVSYLSLASEISGEQGRGKTIAVMFVLMIIGIILTSMGLSRLLDPYSSEALISSFRIVGIFAFGLGLLGLFRLEERSITGAAPAAERHSWKVMAQAVFKNKQARLFFWYLIILLAALLGQDILLEPYAAEAFHMSVSVTTRITAIWGVSMLFTLIIAGILEGRVYKKKVARVGGWGAFSGFFLIVLSGIVNSPGIFYVGVVLLGAGTGLATVSNLSLMLDMTTAGNVGLFIGAWGIANAASRLIGYVVGGALRDAVTQFAQNIETGYIVVFSLEGLMILISLFMLSRINVSAFRENAAKMGVVERAAVANEA